mmetsp:Transcript_17155/g.24355  ORF Transcript_17155/g.24355 Transcript_17155/m.24355 type:complete len:200 (+) Transcript_17155:628-1227(+)
MRTSSPPPLHNSKYRGGAVSEGRPHPPPHHRQSPHGPNGMTRNYSDDGRISASSLPPLHHSQYRGGPVTNRSLSLHPSPSPPAHHRESPHGPNSVTRNYSYYNLSHGGSHSSRGGPPPPGWLLQRNKTVIVRRLDYDIDEETLYKKFKYCGAIISIQTTRKGHAFIEFKSTYAIENALAMDREKINGCRCEVRPFTERV